MNINNIEIAVIIYLLIINLTAMFMTISDKNRAVSNRWRISEHSLIIVALLGGSFFEYLTMKKIHHKTQHMKFMIGLPIIIFVQIVLFVIIVYKVAF